MKYGQTVIVCCDGKLPRSTPGKVIKPRNGHHIKVRFVPWGASNLGMIEMWFRLVNKDRAAHFGYFRGKIGNDYYSIPNNPWKRAINFCLEQGGINNE